MARPLRIEYEDACYHVFSRGNEKKPIYADSKDRKKFLECLKQACIKFRIIIHVYCLMKNHYHLIVQTPQANLSKAMQFVGTSYTVYYNRKMRRAGHLFQGRYKTILIEKDFYMEELSRYIHLNPVRKGIVARPQDYLWSSYRYYLNDEKCPSFLTRDFLLSYFGNEKNKAIMALREFTEGVDPSKIKNPFGEIKFSTFLASDKFIKEIKQKYLSLDKNERDSDLLAFNKIRKSCLSVEFIISAIEEMKELSEKNKRKFMIYFIRKYTSATLTEISHLFRGLTPAAIHQACVRLEKKKEEDAETAGALAKMEKMLKVQV